LVGQNVTEKGFIRLTLRGDGRRGDGHHLREGEWRCENQWGEKEYIRQKGDLGVEGGFGGGGGGKLAMGKRWSGRIVYVPGVSEGGFTGSLIVLTGRTCDWVLGEGGKRGGGPKCSSKCNKRRKW